MRHHETAMSLLSWTITVSPIVVIAGTAAGAAIKARRRKGRK